MKSCLDFSSKWQNSKTSFLSCSSVDSIFTMPFSAAPKCYVCEPDVLQKKGLISDINESFVWLCRGTTPCPLPSVGQLNHAIRIYPSIPHVSISIYLSICASWYIIAAASAAHFRFIEPLIEPVTLIIMMLRTSKRTPIESYRLTNTLCCKDLLAYSNISFSELLN